MLPTAAEEGVGELQTYAVTDLAATLEVWVKTLSEGVLHDGVAINQGPFGAGGAAFGYYLHNAIEIYFFLM